jgi:hypothetical protein
MGPPCKHHSRRADLVAVAPKYHSGTKASSERGSLCRVAKMQRAMNIFRFPVASHHDPWQNLESDRVGADARATRRGRLWAVRPTARARPKGAAIHQKGTLTSAFLFWLPTAQHASCAKVAEVCLQSQRRCKCRDRIFPDTPWASHRSYSLLHRCGPSRPLRTWPSEPSTGASTERPGADAGTRTYRSVVRAWSRRRWRLHRRSDQNIFLEVRFSARFGRRSHRQR